MEFGNEVEPALSLVCNAGSVNMARDDAPQQEGSIIRPFAFRTRRAMLKAWQEVSPVLAQQSLRWVPNPRTKL